MESIFYNPQDKKVGIVLGYGIGNHLSLNHLTEIVNDIKTIFPLLKEKANDIKFYEVSRQSRRHKNMFYTVFDYDLSENGLDKNGIYKVIDKNNKAYICNKHVKGFDGWTHESETCEQLMYRMIND